jgi:hypothetical protein
MLIMSCTNTLANGNSGGAGLSNDGTGSNGGTNHMGEVFAGNGEAVHEGLIVCDGALVPAALGVNPFATITALAERSVELVAEKRDIKIDYETKNGMPTRLNLSCNTKAIRYSEPLRQTCIPSPR